MSKTIKISDHSHSQLKKLSKTHDLDMGGFVEAAIQYFKRTGENPADPHSSPQAALEEMNKRLSQVIGFIRKQEENHLLPIVEKLSYSNKLMEEYLYRIDPDKLNKVFVNFNILMTGLEKSNRQIISRQQHDGERLKTLGDLCLVLSKMQSLDKGIFTANKDQKAELRNQINKLDQRIDSTS